MGRPIRTGCPGIALMHQWTGFEPEMSNVVVVVVRRKFIAQRDKDDGLHPAAEVGDGRQVGRNGNGGDYPASFPFQGLVRTVGIASISG